jgi:ATP-dependent DNA ligase
MLDDHLDQVFPCRRLPNDGAKAWSMMVEERGYEGMVVKDPRSTYRSGATRAWVRVKVRHERVFVVGGIRDVDAFDEVLVGQEVDGGLYYRGIVEWGYGAHDVLELLREAELPARSSPFADLRSIRGAVWLEPRLRGDQLRGDHGGRLRAPSWRRLLTG